MNRLIAVYGPIGAGKTYSTNKIKEYADHIGIPCKVFNCDKLAKEIFANNSKLKYIMDMFRYNHNKLDATIVFSLDWQEFIQPIINKLIFNEVERLHTDTIAIIEFAIIPPEFMPYIDYAYYVDTPVDIRKQRVLERGKTEEYFNDINKFQEKNIKHHIRSTQNAGLIAITLEHIKNKNWSFQDIKEPQKEKITETSTTIDNMIRGIL